MNYEISNQDPYTGAPLDNGWRGILIKEKWNNNYFDIIHDEKIDCIFLNYAKGWSCDDYSFFKHIKYLQKLDIIDIHDTGIKSIEMLALLIEISLNLPLKTYIDFSTLKNLQTCFIYYSKYTQNIFTLTNLKKLHICRLNTSSELNSFFYLEEFTLAQSTINSLSFFQSMPNLKKLELLDCKKIDNFSPISTLEELEWLRIDGYKNIEDLSFLTSLNNLSVLILSNVGKIRSVSVLNKLINLQAVAIVGTNTIIEDGDLEVFTKLPKLSMLNIIDKKHYNYRLVKSWSWDNYGKIDLLVIPKK